MIALLAPTLGFERSSELVAETAHALGKNGTLSPGDVQQLLAVLSRHEGLIGVTARFASRRVATSIVPSQQVTKATPAATVALKTIEAMFEPALGAEKSREVVATYGALAGIAGPTCTHDQATRLLEAMAKADGLVGVTARFAKARLLLHAQ